MDFKLFRLTDFGYADQIKEFRDSLLRPGLLIARFNLMELLDVSEIHDLVSVQEGRLRCPSLLMFSLEYSPSSTVIRLAELFPEQLQPSTEEYKLHAAARRHITKVVQMLLDNGEDINLTAHDRDSALLQALQNWKPPLINQRSLVQTVSKVASEDMVGTIKVLLNRGANIYDVDSFGRPSIHLAVLRGRYTIPRLLVEHAVQLEQNQLHGSVQRLLRMRDSLGRLPRDVATSEDVKYLDDELEKAVQRDGKVMYDFGGPDIEDIRSGTVKMDYLKNYPISIRPRVEDIASVDDQYWR